jgi:hypothetical protein
MCLPTQTSTLFQTSTPFQRSRARALAALLATSLSALGAAGAWAQGLAPGASLVDTPATVRTLQFGNPTLGLALGARTRLVYEPRPLRPWADANAAVVGAPAEPRLGLEFKSVSPATGASNLFRVQMSGGAALQFRPRGGGMTVAYKAQF